MSDPPVGGLAPGPDGRLRCWWSTTAPELVGYHDEEWGRLVASEDGLFEKVSLEAFQSGLSWLTILRKREAFREVFSGFDVEAVAAMEVKDVDRLLGDARIVRNRAKIEATVGNARAVLALPDGLHAVVARHRPAPRPRPTALADVPATSPEAVALAKELKGAGLRFVGPTTCYALMQATGQVDDHLAGCWVPAAAA